MHTRGRVFSGGRLWWVLCALACLFSGRSARADEAVPRGASGAVVREGDAGAAPAAPVVTPPVLKRDEGAKYPAEALKAGIRGEVKVPLLLVVDEGGKVVKVDVERQVGNGFDEAASEAAAKMEFEPAKRDGVPFKSKIRFAYTVRPPPAVVSGRISAAEGGTITGAEVRLRGADGKELVRTTGPDGKFRFEGLAPGKYTVTVSEPSRKPVTVEEEAAAGEETSVVYRLEPIPQAPGVVDAGAGAAPAVTEPEVQEVLVKGVRPPREVTRRTLEQREIQRIPGTGGDALRSLINLPGVARPPGAAGLLIVRGSNPQDTNVFVDGALIPIVYHFGGLSSVVPSELLDKIDFYPGNFSAQYGRVMGGVVDVGIRDPKKDGRAHAMAQFDLIDGRFLVEAPLAKSGWNFALAGRRSWVDVWLKPVLEQTGAGVTTAPVYYDYQAMVARDFGKGQSFRLLFFGSDDRLDILIKSVSANEPNLTGGISSHTGFWRLQGRYRNRMSRDTELRLMTAVGQDFIDFRLGDLLFRLDSYPVAARAELSQKLAQRLNLNLGMDTLWIPYDVTVRAPPPPRPGEPPGGPFLSRPPLTTTDKDALYRPALYAELEATPWKAGRIVPGIRLDYAKDIKAWNVGPRLTVRQDIQSEYPRTTIKGGAGIFYQPPQPQETNLVFGQPGLRANKAIHYGLGFERELTRNIELSMEGFYKDLSDLVIPRNSNSGTGTIFGLETLLRYKPDPRFFGWIAYTLSRSERQDTPNDPVRLTPFDQTHILTVLGSYRLGRGWELGARFRFVSGNRFTLNQYGFYDQNAGAYLPLQSYPPFGTRLPSFHQLDIRLDRTWVFQDKSKFSFFLDIQNVYNHGNVEGVVYNYNYTRSTFATGLPIIPSVGLRAEM